MTHIPRVSVDRISGAFVAVCGDVLVRHNLTRTQGAEFSTCRSYRYRLRYSLTGGDVAATPERAVLFVMLNPSTADELEPDPTVRRCMGFARSWGATDLLVANLFALRSTDPAALKSHPNPIGPLNDAVFSDLPRSCTIIAAWGAHPMAKDRAKRVVELIGRPLFALGVTKDGHPRHPLYMPAKSCPLEWKP